MATQRIRTIIDGKEIGGTGKAVLNPYSGHITATYEEISSLPSFRGPKYFSNNQNLSTICEKLANELEKDRNKIALMASNETGSPIRYNLDDVQDIVNYLREIDKYKDERNYILTPKGAVLLSLSANEPVILGTIPLIVALLSGNKVFIKPSSKSPSYSYYIVKKLLSLGVSYDRLSFLTLSRECYQNLIKESYFDMVLSFATNSVNQTLSVLAAPTDTEFISENEGNDWMYIDDTGQFTEDEVVEIILNSVTKHNGQMCDSIKGIFINKKLYGSFVSKIKLRLEKIKIGDPTKFTTDIGALLLGTFDKIPEYVERFKPYVQNVFNYGYYSEKNIVRPTMLENLSFDSLVTPIDPCFGPVFFINPIDNVNSVINYYKTCNNFGLCFSLFTSKEEVISEVTNNISVGRLNINTNPVDVVASSPWGGVKLSGHGGPRSWLERFTNRKLINIGNYSK